MHTLKIVGRRSSLFTRLPLIFAEELAVPYEIVPIYDMTAVGPEAYAGNPALKLPILRGESSVLFGAQNICRAVAERTALSQRIIWPEALRDDLSRNAHELLWHAMSTQVQLVMGTVINSLPAENGFFAKATASFEGALRWLDTNLAATLAALPPRDLSLFEVSLFCLIDHLAFRPTLPVAAYASLRDFSQEFSRRESARRTLYRFDAP